MLSVFGDKNIEMINMIMNIENKGHYPSFDLFVKLITMFDVSVDQFIHADGGSRIRASVFLRHFRGCR